MVSIQFSHTSHSKYKCFSPFGNIMSCFFFTPWFCSFNYLSYGNVICGISCLCSFNHLSYGHVICGIVVVCLTTYTTVGTTFTTIDIGDGSIMPLIISYALKYVLSYSLFTFKHDLLLQLCFSF